MSAQVEDGAFTIPLMKGISKELFSFRIRFTRVVIR